MECFGAAITKQPNFLPENGKKRHFLGLKQCFCGVSGQLWGPPPYFEGAGLTEKMFRKVLEQLIEFFGAAITQKPRFWPENGQKKPFLGLKQCMCLEPEWSAVEQMIKGSGANITKKPLSLRKKCQFFGLQQHFWGMSGQL